MKSESQVLPKMEATINVAIIGHGHLGKWHLEKALACVNVNVAYIIEHNQQTRIELAKKYPQIIIDEDCTRIFGHVDAAFVVTPTSTHFDIVIQLLKNDIHVFCEKPLTANTSQAQAVADLLKVKKLFLQVGHSERYHLCWDMLEQYRQIIDSFSVVIFNRLAVFKGRALDVDVVTDLMIHDLDLFDFIFKTKVKEMTSTAVTIRGDQYDQVRTHFKLADNKNAYFTAARYALHEVRDMEVISPLGSIRFDLLNNKISSFDITSENNQIVLTEQSYQKRDHLMEEHKDFYHAIRTLSQPKIGIKEGLQSVYYIEKVIESITRKVTDLP